MEITITDRAKEYLKEQIKSGGYMKVDLRKAGCCSYEFNIRATRPSSEDKVYDIDGVEIAVGLDAQKYLKKFKIDYRRKGFRKDLEILPNM
ncbi:MAG: iron-sulfur cluster biosynthesis family protein [Anaerovoracaceae bacterium]